MSEKLIGLEQLRSAALASQGLIGEVAAAAAEAVEAVTPKVQAVTLTAAGWTGSAAPYSQTVAVPGVLEDVSAQLIHILPDDPDAWAAAGARCTGQGAGALTFEAKEKVEMGIFVVLQEVAG